jgi:hypothetical protein
MADYRITLASTARVALPRVPCHRTSFRTGDHVRHHVERVRILSAGAPHDNVLRTGAHASPLRTSPDRDRAMRAGAALPVVLRSGRSCADTRLDTVWRRVYVSNPTENLSSYKHPIGPRRPRPAPPTTQPCTVARRPTGRPHSGCRSRTSTMRHPPPITPNRRTLITRSPRSCKSVRAIRPVAVPATYAAGNSVVLQARRIVAIPSRCIKSKDRSPARCACNEPDHPLRRIPRENARTQVLLTRPHTIDRKR